MRYLAILLFGFTLFAEQPKLQLMMKTDHIKVAPGVVELIRSAGEEVATRNGYQLGKSKNRLTITLKRHGGKELVMKGILELNGIKKYKTLIYNNREDQPKRVLDFSRRMVDELFNPRVKRIIKVSSDAEFNLSTTWNHNEIKGLADTILKKMSEHKGVKRSLKQNGKQICVERFLNESGEQLPLGSLIQLLQKGIVDHPELNLMGRCNKNSFQLQGRVTLLKGKKNSMITKSYMISISLVKPDQAIIWMHVENLKKIILLNRK